MIDVVRAHGGVVDKLLGDGILAYWGWPDESGDHASRALAAAIRMREEMALANRAAASIGEGPFRSRTGLSTGRVTIGEIGNEARADFTLIGRHVNLAARLCAAAAPDEILVGDDCRLAAGPEWGERLTERPALEVKGFDAPVAVHVVAD